MDKGDDYDIECDDKVCFLSGSGDEMDLDRMKHLVKNSNYVCSTCGRSAMHERNLCAPEKL